MGVVLSSARDPLTLSLVSVAKTDLGGKNLEEVLGQEGQHEEVKKKNNRGGKVAQSMGQFLGPNTTTARPPLYWWPSSL